MPKLIVLEQGQGHFPSGYMVLAYTFSEGGRRKACFVERETVTTPYSDDWEIECVDTERAVKSAATKAREAFLDTRARNGDT